MSTSKVNTLLDLWASSLYPHGASPPFTDHRHMLNTIDLMTVGDVWWQSLSVRYTGEIPEIDPRLGCHKNTTSGFETLVLLCIKYLLILVLRMVDLCPFQEYTTDDQIQQYKDFMSGDWAWDQAVCFLTLFWSYWLTHANRTPYPRMRALLGVHSSLSFWVVIKRQFQLLQATMSTIRCICPLGMFTTVYDEHIGMHSSWSASWQYPKVGFFLSPLNVTH